MRKWRETTPKWYKFAEKLNTIQVGNTDMKSFINDMQQQYKN